MRIPHNSCVLVADGRKMLFFRNEGDGEFPNLEIERKRVDHNPYDRDQGSDTAGRTFSSAGIGVIPTPTATRQAAKAPTSCLRIIRYLPAAGWRLASCLSSSSSSSRTCRAS